MDICPYSDFWCFWLNHSIALIVALVTSIGVILAAYVGFRYAVKQLAEELRARVQQTKNDKILEALQKCWGLLAFTSDVENPLSIITYQLNQDKTKTYYLHRANAEKFLSALSEMFYVDGHGLFLPRSVRPLLFHYRNIIFGVLLAERKNTSGQFTIKTETAEILIKHHNSLILELRKAIGMEEPIIDK